jgi:hypothetical protein
MAWLDSRAERLLEAVETMTELVQPPKACVSHSSSALLRPRVTTRLHAGA